MPEVLPRHYVFGIIFFTLVISVGLILISSFAGTQSDFVDNNKYPQFQSSFDKSSNIQSQVTTLQSGVQSKPDWGIFGVLNSIISSVWNTVTLLFTGLFFMGDVFAGPHMIFGLNPIFGVMLGVLVAAMLAFAIFTLAFYREV